MIILMSKRTFGVSPEFFQTILKICDTIIQWECYHMKNMTGKLRRYAPTKGEEQKQQHLAKNCGPISDLQTPIGGPHSMLYFTS